MRDRISPEFLDVLKSAFEEWEDEVNRADLAIATKQTYTQHPKRFIMWIVGEYHLPPPPRE